MVNVGNIAVVAGAAALSAVVVLLRQNNSHPREDDEDDKAVPAQNGYMPAATQRSGSGPQPQAAMTPLVQHRTSGRSTFSTWMLVLASMLLASAAAVCAIRGSWDVAVAVLAAWVVLITTKASSPGSSVVVAAGPVVEPQQPFVMPDIAGTWLKDHSASDSMEPALRIMRMNGIMRTAIRLIKGVRIRLERDSFEVAVFSVFAWFKVIERYALNGAVSEWARRDFRRGRHRGVIRPTPHGSLLLSLEWDDPLGGVSFEEFCLDEDGRLLVKTVLTVGSGNNAETTRYTQVYRRKGGP